MSNGTKHKSTIGAIPSTILDPVNIVGSRSTLNSSRFMSSTAFASLSNAFNTTLTTLNNVNSLINGYIDLAGIVYLNNFISTASSIPDVPGLTLTSIAPTISLKIFTAASVFRVLGTPGSDAIATGTSEIDNLLTREGNDVLLAVNPGEALPGQGENDTLVGGGNRDRYILGDWRKPYYDDGNRFNPGVTDAALILSFNPQEDVIQLHGTASNYVLLDFASLGLQGAGTAIYLTRRGEVPELIGLISGVSGLSLTASYFQYKNSPPPGPTQPQIRQFGGGGSDFSFDIATDGAGGLYLGGWTSDALGGSNAGSDDAWVSRYQTNGQQQWVRQLGTNRRDNAYRLAADSQGNVYLTGWTEGSLGGANQGGNDAWVSKYDRNGNLVWIRQFGTIGLDVGRNIDVDGTGNVYVTGYTLGDLAGTNPDGISNTTDAWITKFDPNGNQIWIKQFGTATFDEAFGIATTQSGNSYATGWTIGDLGGPNASGPEVPETERYDGWVAKYDTNGHQQWIRQFGSPDYEFSWDAATDAQENVYVTGFTRGNLAGPSNGFYDAFIVKYNASGTQQWVKQIGTAGDETAFGITTDAVGNIYVVGTTDNNFGGTNAGSYDAWVAKYTPNGNQLWLKQFGTPDLEQAADVVVTNGSVYVSGFTEGSLGAANAGSYDPWLARLSATDGNLLSFG